MDRSLMEVMGVLVRGDGRWWVLWSLGKGG